MGEKNYVQRKDLRKKNEKWRKDSAYISYVNSGESAAVFVVRDIAASLNTDGKWIDIISFSTYKKTGSGNRWSFHWIVAELFPRKLIPKYMDLNFECDYEYEYDEEYISEYNRYLTWYTARQDIMQQRRGGYRGSKYLVLCELVNINKSGKPEWKYKIQDVRKINDKQIQFIENHKSGILNKIIENRKPTLDILGIK